MRNFLFAIVLLLQSCGNDSEIERLLNELNPESDNSSEQGFSISQNETSRGILVGTIKAINNQLILELSDWSLSNGIASMKGFQPFDTSYIIDGRWQPRVVNFSGLVQVDNGTVYNAYPKCGSCTFSLRQRQYVIPMDFTSTVFVDRVGLQETENTSTETEEGSSTRFSVTANNSFNLADEERVSRFRSTESDNNDLLLDFDFCLNFRGDSCGGTLNDRINESINLSCDETRSAASCLPNEIEIVTR